MSRNTINLVQTIGTDSQVDTGLAIKRISDTISNARVLVTNLDTIVEARENAISIITNDDHLVTGIALSLFMFKVLPVKLGLISLINKLEEFRFCNELGFPIEVYLNIPTIKEVIINPIGVLNLQNYYTTINYVYSSQLINNILQDMNHPTLETLQVPQIVIKDGYYVMEEEELPTTSEEEMSEEELNISPYGGTVDSLDSKSSILGCAGANPAGGIGNLEGKFTLEVNTEGWVGGTIGGDSPPN